MPESNLIPDELSFEQKAERVWKWTLRGIGAMAFLFTLVMALVFKANVPLGAWVIIGGMCGLPNALPLAQAVAAWKGPPR